MALILLLLISDSLLNAAESTTIHIGTLPGLRYDIKQFDVTPNAEVEIIFKNQDTMLHNLVIVKNGSRVPVVTAAIRLGTKAVEKHYVPDSPDVLWATQVVVPGESSTLRFTAPSEAGDYPFVCTYPGHGFIMHGIMRVTSNPKAPEKNTETIGTPHHASSSTEAAIVKRAFMPRSGPASIAVKLSTNHSYCWDAGACCFRYAWTGGFVEPIYRKPEKVIGDVYYQENHKFPFLLGKSDPKPLENIQFHGYALDSLGIPEFEYEADGIRFWERLEIRNEQLVRRFRSDAKPPASLWFRIDSEHAEHLDSTGLRDAEHFHFQGNDLAEFYITFSPNNKSSDPTSGNAATH